MKNKIFSTLSIFFATVFTLLLIVAIASLPYWTFFPEWTGFQDKKAWDLIELLIVPLFLAIGATIFSQLQRNTEIQIETERQRESSFQTYIDRIKDMIVELYTSETDLDTLGNIGAAYTRATLQGLDAKRKVMLLEFLYHTQLIGWAEKPFGERQLQLIFLGENADFSGLIAQASYGPMLTLCGVNLAQVNLSNSKLIGLDFHKAYLSSCNMSNSSIASVDFSDADMSGINLYNTQMGEGVFFDRAELRFANFKNADLRKVNLNNVNSIFEARYNRKTKLPKGFDPTKAKMVFEE